MNKKTILQGTLQEKNLIDNPMSLAALFAFDGYATEECIIESDDYITWKDCSYRLSYNVLEDNYSYKCTSEETIKYDKNKHEISIPCANVFDKRGIEAILKYLGKTWFFDNDEDGVLYALRNGISNKSYVKIITGEISNIASLFEDYLLCEFGITLAKDDDWKSIAQLWLYSINEGYQYLPLVYKCSTSPQKMIQFILNNTDNKKLSAFIKISILIAAMIGDQINDNLSENEYLNYYIEKQNLLIERLGFSEQEKLPKEQIVAIENSIQAILLNKMKIIDNEYARFVSCLQYGESLPMLENVPKSSITLIYNDSYLVHLYRENDNIYYSITRKIEKRFEDKDFNDEVIESIVSDWVNNYEILLLRIITENTYC